MKANRLGPIIERLSALGEDDGHVVLTWVSRTKALIDGLLITAALMFLALMRFLADAWTLTDTVTYACVIILCFLVHYRLSRPLTQARDVLIRSQLISEEDRRRCVVQARILYWSIAITAFLVCGLLDSALLGGLA